MTRAGPSRPRGAARSELEQWVRTELRQRGPARPAPPPSAPPRAPWFKLKGLGGGWGFVHGAGPMLEAVGQTLDWAQEILVHALLGNVPWSVVGSFLKLVLLPSGRRVEDYVTEQDFEALRTSVQLRVAAKKTGARKKHAPSTSKRPRAAKKAAPSRKSRSVDEVSPRGKPRARRMPAAKKKATSKPRATPRASPSKKAPSKKAPSKKAPSKKAPSKKASPSRKASRSKKAPAAKTARSPAKRGARPGERPRGRQR